MRTQTYVLLALIALALGGCSALNHFGEFREGMDAGPRPDAGRDAFAVDAPMTEDATVSDDAAATQDAFVTPDAFVAPDAFVTPDAPMPADAFTAPDANVDAR
jgi:hypothetical protein